MRNPLDSYLPEDPHDPPLRPVGYDRFRWVQWLQMGLTTALGDVFQPIEPIAGYEPQDCTPV